jgi:hypothetical protein
MKNTTEIKQEEYMGDTTDVFSQLIEARKEILKLEMEIQKKTKENNEIKRDSGLMAMDLNINRLSYANNFTDFEQKIALYLLDGQTTVESKFEVLGSLLTTRRHIKDILGDLEIEEENEKGENK